MYKLLIAEDELIERMVLKKTLQKKFAGQCELYEAPNGKEAVEIFLREKVQVVILDINMPGMNGIQAAEMMRRENPGCCLIFLTAYDRFEYARKAVSVRAMEYLLKPYSIKEIIGVVEEALRLTQEYEAWNVGRGTGGGGAAAEIGRAAAGTVGAAAGTGGAVAGTAGLTPPLPAMYAPTAQPSAAQPPTAQPSATLPSTALPPAPPEEDAGCTRLTVMTAMVEEYIRANYMYEISMSDAARAVNYSEPYFCKMFKQQFGQNFTSYLADYRITEAKKLLDQPNVIVKEVGARVGYPDSNYFTKVFRRLTGVNPSEYRMEKLKTL